MFGLRRDLSLRLLAFYLLFVAPVSVGAFVFQNLASRRVEADVKSADLALARAVAQETNTVMANALQAVSTLAENPSVTGVEMDDMPGVFETLAGARPDVNLVYRLGPDGIMLYHYPEGPGSTLGTDFSFREYFQRAQLTRGPLVSIGRISPTTEQPVATAVMPVWDEQGDFQGVVATNMKLQFLSSALMNIISEQRQGLEIAIIDSAGQVIAHADPAKLLSDSRLSTSPSMVNLVLQGDTGSGVIRNQNGGERLVSYIPIESAGWGVLVSRPTAVAFATSRVFQQAAFAAIVVFLLGGLAFWVALSRQVILPLEWLASFSQDIGEDHFISDAHRRSIRSLASRQDQIGHLGQSLERMQQSIESRLNELATLLQTSAAVVSTLHSQGVLERILEQVEHLMGIERSAIVAWDEGPNQFRVQAHRGLSQEYAEQVTIDPDEPQSVALRAMRDQSPVQISDTEQNAQYQGLRPRARQEGYQALLAVPLQTQHAPPSALLVYYAEPHFFSRQEIGLLTSFANHAAMAIENAFLYARSDMQLQEQSRRLEALIQSMQDGLVLEDLSGGVLYVNRTFQELTGFSDQQVRRASADLLMQQILDKTVDPEKTQQAVQKVLEKGSRQSVELALKTQEETRYFRMRIFDVTDFDGKRIGRGRILQDITRLKELDRMKSSLISTVSHELRTPLAAIKGYATTLLADDVEWDPNSQREFLEIISEETDSLNALINDLLDMSRIEAGSLTVSRSSCDLRDLVMQAAGKARPAPEGRLQMEIPADFPMLYVDSRRIETVLRNLIENAAKYTQEDCGITVHAACSRQEEAVISVCDEGGGIPQELRTEVFSSFYRVENGLTRSTPGAGLGLAICQGFVHAHGGRIWIEPQEKGTRVSFTIPLISSKKAVKEVVHE